MSYSILCQKYKLLNLQIIKNNCIPLLFMLHCFRMVFERNYTDDNIIFFHYKDWSAAHILQNETYYPYNKGIIEKSITLYTVD